MRHGVKTKKLGRNREHRKAMLKNLATSILLKGLSTEQMDRQVRTTIQKAKAVRSLVDRLITYAKKGDLSAKRQAARFIQDKEAFQGLFQVIGSRYASRNGGYTRVLKLLDYRHGDNAEMAIVSLVEDEILVRPKKKNSAVKEKNIQKSMPKEKQKKSLVEDEKMIKKSTVSTVDNSSIEVQIDKDTEKK